MYFWLHLLRTKLIGKNIFYQFVTELSLECKKKLVMDLKNQQLSSNYVVIEII